MWHRLITRINIYNIPINLLITANILTSCIFIKHCDVVVHILEVLITNHALFRFFRQFHQAITRPDLKTIITASSPVISNSSFIMIPPVDDKWPPAEKISSSKSNKLYSNRRHTLFVVLKIISGKTVFKVTSFRILTTFLVTLFHKEWGS